MTHLLLNQSSMANHVDQSGNVTNSNITGGTSYRCNSVTFGIYNSSRHYSGVSAAFWVTLKGDTACVAIAV